MSVWIQYKHMDIVKKSWLAVTLHLALASWVLWISKWVLIFSRAGVFLWNDVDTGLLLLLDPLAQPSTTYWKIRLGKEYLDLSGVEGLSDFL